MTLIRKLSLSCEIACIRLGWQVHNRPSSRLLGHHGSLWGTSPSKSDFGVALTATEIGLMAEDCSLRLGETLRPISRTHHLDYEALKSEMQEDDLNKRLPK